MQYSALETFTTRQMQMTDEPKGRVFIRKNGYPTIGNTLVVRKEKRSVFLLRIGRALYVIIISRVQ